MAKKFEYKILEPHVLENHKKQPNEEFVQLGQEGWELVAAYGNGAGSKLYFKREIESSFTHKQERSNYDMSR